MKYLKREKFFYKFSRDTAPVMTVDPGETVVIESEDALGGQIKDENSVVSAIDWDVVNPATGPVYINGAKAGDVLKVNILKIEIENSGAVMTAENSGFFGSKIKGRHFKIAAVKGDSANVGGIEFKLNKMIGVIGVAPGGEGVNTGTPGSHGGNMDNKKIAEGASLYLPVFADGALFGLGDLHAVMADGEAGVSGVEIAGKVTVTFEVLKGLKLKNPLLEDEGYFHFIGSAATLDGAADIAFNDAFDLVSAKTGFAAHEAAMFLSLCGNLEVCQIVDPLKTVRVAVAKAPLLAAGFTL